MKTNSNDVDGMDKKIARLETHIGELERLLREEQAHRSRVEARYEEYSTAVRDLGRREGDGIFPFHPMMFRRY